MNFTCLSFALLRSSQPVCVKCMIIFLGWKSKNVGGVLQAAEQLEGGWGAVLMGIRKQL